MHLDVRDLAREDALNDIGPVETIHAVRAHHTCLRAQDLTRVLYDQLTLAKADLHLSHEVPIAEHLLFDDIHQLA